MKHQSGTITKVLMIGKNSFLASGILDIESSDLTFDCVSHTVDFASIDFSAYDVVVNMAYDPSYMKQPYREEFDFDLNAAKHVAKSSSHYVLLSTRRVYGAKMPFRISEKCLPEPVEHYGRNKLRTETEVQALLGQRCTILRVANVFGFEPGRHTFFGIALGTLKRSNRILLDVSPFVARDFIYIDDFVTLLKRVLLHRPHGVYNLGSGHATQLGRLALWIIEGYEDGVLLVTSPAERDSFELDIQKLTSCIGPLGRSLDVRARCIEIGRKLRDA
jgi:nucleoside-diphosphate-sugar epimerase